jgi:phenol 2-monooxygenase
MNVSMNDTWNLGWKLGAVLRGRAKPELLHTYSEERQTIAKQLIDFDREFAKMFSAHPTESNSTGAGGVDPEEFRQYFITQGRFTAGVATKYGPSMITAEAMFQHLAEGFPVGMRFHSAPVVRLADAKPVHLGHVARADGAWRLYIFAERNGATSKVSQFRELCEFLDFDSSPIKRFTPAHAEPDSVIDVRAIFQQGHRDLAVDEMPSVLLPKKGKCGLIDYEKCFCPDLKAGDIFDMRRVNRETGCMVVVRPDQYVSHVLPLHAYERLADFFAEILINAR